MYTIKKNYHFSIFCIYWCAIINSATSHYDPDQLYFKTVTSTVIIANKIKNGELLDETHFKYGSLIHPKIVLTLTEVIMNKIPTDLVVYTGCYSDWYIFPKSCDNKINAVRIYHIPNIDNNEDINIESKYSFIYLKTPAVFRGRLQIATLLKSNQIVDRSSCIIYSYMHHINSKTESFNSFITPLKASERENGSISIELYRNYSLIDNHNLQLKIERSQSYISFIGSPIMCQLQNSTDYVQVAISNLKLDFLTTSKTVAIFDSSEFKVVSLNFSPDDVKIIDSLLPTELPYSVVYVLSI